MNYTFSLTNGHHPTLRGVKKLELSGSKKEPQFIRVSLGKGEEMHFNISHVLYFHKEVE